MVGHHCTDEPSTSRRPPRLDEYLESSSSSLISLTENKRYPSDRSSMASNTPHFPAHKGENDEGTDEFSLDDLLEPDEEEVQRKQHLQSTSLSTTSTSLINDESVNSFHESLMSIGSSAVPSSSANNKNRRQWVSSSETTKPPSTPKTKLNNSNNSLQAYLEASCSSKMSVNSCSSSAIEYSDDGPRARRRTNSINNNDKGRSSGSTTTEQENLFHQSLPNLQYSATESVCSVSAEYSDDGPRARRQSSCRNITVSTNSPCPSLSTNKETRLPMSIPISSEGPNAFMSESHRSYFQPHLSASSHYPTTSASVSSNNNAISGKNTKRSSSGWRQLLRRTQTKRDSNLPESIGENTRSEMSADLSTSMREASPVRSISTNVEESSPSFLSESHRSYFKPLSSSSHYPAASSPRSSIGDEKLGPVSLHQPSQGSSQEPPSLFSGSPRSYFRSLSSSSSHFPASKSPRTSSGSGTGGLLASLRQSLRRTQSERGSEELENSNHSALPQKSAVSLFRSKSHAEDHTNDAEDDASSITALPDAHAAPCRDGFQRTQSERLEAGRRPPPRSYSSDSKHNFNAHADGSVCVTRLQAALRAGGTGRMLPPRSKSSSSGSPNATSRTSTRVAPQRSRSSDLPLAPPLPPPLPPRALSATEAPASPIIPSRASDAARREATDFRYVRSYRVKDPNGQDGLYTGFISNFSSSPCGSDGRLDFANGGYYKGEWLHGVITGKGVLLNELRGYLYEGEFMDNYKHGQGSITYPDGRFAEGKFILGDLKEGCMIFPNGATYTGPFRNGKRHGIRGTYVYQDGSTYVGNFENDAVSGHGTMTWPDGSKHIGEWKDGQQNGFGKELGPNGELRHEGLWHEGAIVA